MHLATQATPARSLAGVIAKLAVAAEWALSEPETDGPPWDFCRSVLSDLTALADGGADDTTHNPTR